MSRDPCTMEALFPRQPQQLRPLKQPPPVGSSYAAAQPSPVSYSHAAAQPHALRIRSCPHHHPTACTNRVSILLASSEVADRVG